MELNEKSGYRHRIPGDNMKSTSLGITRITPVNNINVHTVFHGYVSVWHSDSEPAASMTKNMIQFSFDSSVAAIHHFVWPHGILNWTSWL